ncbi:MAG: hypothetical protein WBK46_19220 [Ruminococcus flavefaciens]
MSRKKYTLSEMSTHTALAKNNYIERSSVHHILLERAVDIVYSHSPGYSRILAPMMKYMLHVVKKPDKKSDCENGLGRHYYCAVNYMGADVSPVRGYYKNGTGSFGKSARSMLEEDYTMALTMYKAGFIMQASGYLARAVHMLSDICCLPHALCMTYFSPSRKIHQAYEKLASYVYPDMVPPVAFSRPLLSFFADRDSFSASLNAIVENVKDELPLLYSDPKREIISRLYDTEIKLAAFLVRFCEDTSLLPEKAHYITEGMICPLFHRSAKVHITEKGIAFMSDGKRISRNFGERSVCTYFSAAHRKMGRFTLSPAKCRDDVIFTKDGYSAFDPRNSKQYFRFR